MINLRQRILFIVSVFLLAVSTVTIAVPSQSAYAAGEQNPTPVFRFYKFKDGAHFFTNNESEKATVSTRPDVYRYEGVAFYSYSTQVVNSSPVYRFYNFRNGTHFYTINQSESNQLQSTATGTYRYEGVAYYAQPSTASETIPVHRFYKFAQGVHFYTNNQAEATNLNNTAGSTYRYEGVAYYLPKYLTFSGTGNQVTESFILPTTLTVFRSTYNGPNGYFGAVLKNANTGEYSDLIANEIGSSVNISKAIGTGENRYVLDVDAPAGGTWTVTIEQPKVSSGYVSDFTGRGTQATQLFSMYSGGKTVSYSHDGSDYFGIWLLDSDGNYVDLIANETGPVQGGTFIAPAAGNYMMNVEADGNWAVSIR